MLSPVELPAMAPQPSVMDGSTPVVMPVDPCGAGVFTSTRNAGALRPYSRMWASSWEKMTHVWPRPPKLSTPTHASTA